MFVVGIILAAVAALLIVAAFISYDGGALFFSGLSCLVAAGVFLMVGAVQSDSRAQAAFMAQCLQDHKEYECVAMWRAGESHTQVVPMPIIVR